MNAAVICGTAERECTAKAEMANSKKQPKRKTNNRKWTETENALFASIISEPTEGYVMALETLALKKSSNNHVFLDIKLHLNQV